MSSRHQPSEGADSARPYRVAVVDRYDPDDRPRWITLTAFGVNDLKHQVDEMEKLLLKWEEAA